MTEDKMRVAIFHVNGVVKLQHFKPEKLTQERLSEAVMVERESIPERPPTGDDKRAVLKVDPGTKKLWYDVVDR